MKKDFQIYDIELITFGITLIVLYLFCIIADLLDPWFLKHNQLFFLLFVVAPLIAIWGHLMIK